MLPAISSYFTPFFSQTSNLEPTREQENELYEAAKTGNLSQIKILDRQCKFSSMNIDSALHYARDADRAEVVEYLATVHRETYNPSSNLYLNLDLAIREYRPKTISRLLKIIQIRENRSFTALEGLRSFFVKTKLIQESGPTNRRLTNFNKYFQSDNAPSPHWRNELPKIKKNGLHQGAVNGNLDIVKLVLEKFEHDNEDITTATMTALTSDQAEVMEYLLKKSSYCSGYVLEIAATKNSPKSVKALLETHRQAINGRIYNLLQPLWKFLRKKEVISKSNQNYDRLKQFKDSFAKGKIARSDRKTAYDQSSEASTRALIAETLPKHMHQSL